MGLEASRRAADESTFHGGCTEFGTDIDTNNSFQTFSLNSPWLAGISG